MREGADLERVAADITRLLAERHGEEDVTVLTQDAVVATFSQILGALTLALGAIAAISLSVAGIGIMNVMLVSVSERTREVGLLRAVGVGRRQMLAVFLAEAALLAAAGGLLGLAVGWAAVRVLVAALPGAAGRARRPGRSPPRSALALGVGVLFGLLPARRAARLDPVPCAGGEIAAMRDLIRLALGALAGHRLRSALSMLGIAIGIASVILLTSIGEGTRRYMLAQFTQFGTNLIAINPGQGRDLGHAGRASAARRAS